VRKSSPVQALVALFLLVAPACSGGRPDPRGVFGEPVTLEVGQTIRYPDGLRARLEKIDDSRCPAGSVCVWEGELAPVLRLDGGAIATEQELRLGTVLARRTEAGSYAIVLRAVTPTSATLSVTERGPQAGPADDEIRVTAPIPEQLVESPLTVSGEARGSWYFEASFPVKLLDGNGRLVVARPAQAQGEWMSAEHVPFEAVLGFTPPGTATGTLVLQKSNPAGLPEHDDSRTIPVKFAQ
jgi:hypothetical protein